MNSIRRAKPGECEACLRLQIVNDRRLAFLEGLVAAQFDHVELCESCELMLRAREKKAGVQ